MSALLILQQPKATLSSYYEFWRSLDSVEEANNFLLSLIKASDAKRRDSLDHVLGVSNGSVLATMLLLVLYAPVNAEGKEIRKRLHDIHSKKAASSISSIDGPLDVDAVISMVGRASQPEELRVMVERCSNVTVSDGLPVSELSEHGEIASAFLFGYLLHRLQEQSGIGDVIKTLRGILSFGPSLIPPQKALALLHMLCEILRCCHSFTDEELTPVVREVGLYRTWALPVGHAASEALRALTSEISMRGASMYHSLLREAPWLASAGQGLLSALSSSASPSSRHSSVSSSSSSSFLRSSAARRALTDAFVVHVILDETTDWARAFRAILMEGSGGGGGAGAEEEKVEREEMIRVCLCSMIYSLMKGAGLGIAPNKLSTCSLERLMQCTAMACALSDDLGGEYDGSIAERPMAGLRAIAEVISNAHEPHRQGERSGGYRGRAATENQSAFFGDIRSPRLPPLSLKTLEMKHSRHDTINELRATCEECGPDRRYMFEPVLAALHERLREAAASGSGEKSHPAPLRVCVAGGDGTLHKLVQAYAVLRCAYPKLLAAGGDLLIHLVPISRSHQNKLASFLASQDGWYRRHVFAPHFAGSPTVPHLIMPTGAAAAAGGGSRSPSRYQAIDITDSYSSQIGVGGSGSTVPSLPANPLRSCLNDYLRSATSVLHIKLFEVACWLTPPPDISIAHGARGGGGSSGRLPLSEPPFITIPFAQSVEVVTSSSSAGGSGMLSREGSEGDVGTRGGGIAAAVTYTMADPWGVPYPTPVTTASRFQQLSMHTYCAEPLHSPSSGRLQMRASLATSGKASSGSSNSPRRYITHAAISAGLDAAAGAPGAAEPSSGGRTPRSAGSTFGLLVDGEYYGPFAHVQVGPCLVPGSSEVVTLPVSTFFSVGGEEV